MLYNLLRTTEWTGTNCKRRRNCTFLGYRKTYGNICSTNGKQNKNFKL